MGTKGPIETRADSVDPREESKGELVKINEEEELKLPQEP